MKIKKGDKVIVSAGKDKGRKGTVDRTYANQRKVVVAGVNMVKKHITKSEQTPQGGVVEVPRSFHVSNILLLCPKCGKATKVAYSMEKNGKKRMCKKCKSKF